jgi:hypothetical protein
MLEFHEIPDLRFPGRTFLYTVVNGRMYGASFVDRRAVAEQTIRKAIRESE